MSRWEQVLEDQIRLLNFWRSDQGLRYALGFAGDVKRKGRAGADMYAAVPMIEAAKLERGSPVWVDENVMDLVTAAAPSFKPEPFYPEELFCEEGFAVLPRPQYLTDVNGKRASFRAFSWGPILEVWQTARESHPALHICLYAHADDGDDYSEEFITEAMERSGLSREEVVRNWKRTFGGSLSMFHSVPIRWGQPYEEVMNNPPPGGHPAETAAEEDASPYSGRADVRSLWQFLQAFFRLANQRVLTRTHTRVRRPLRRDAARRGMKEGEGVLVVTLRRPKTPSPEGHEPEEGNWSRRWIVSGHWRNQWYPSLNRHQQIWIAPFVKGPEDKPLVLHADRVYEFTR
jgi:hypothetical protein